MTIPAPGMLHFRPGRQSISKQVYPDLEQFFDDVANASRKALRAFYDAGCRYLQFDDTTWAMMCDARELAHSRERGDEPEKLPAIYARLINRALEGKPADMVVTLHSCRGNFRSAWIAEGGYEPLAERLFNEINIDGYFLEYDTERAGGFEPLRFFPKGKKQLVLGLVTSKSGALEKKDDIKRRIDEATKYVALDQLCLSPQCGFASTEEGNVLSEEEQWAKLAHGGRDRRGSLGLDDVVHQAAVSRRPCRQPVAAGGPERGARATCARRDFAPKRSGRSRIARSRT